MAREPRPAATHGSAPATRSPVAETLLIVLLCVATRIPTLFEPLAMDQSLFAVIGDGLLRGERLYVDLWDHKPPAIYWLYAAVMRLFGGEAWGIALASIAAQCATALLLRAVVARIAGGRAALVAGVFYAVAANPILLGGFYATGQAEVFIEPLVAAAILLAATPSARSWLRAGVVFGAAVALKPTAVLFAPVVVMASRTGGGARPRDAGAPSARMPERSPVRRAAWFCAGAAAAPLASLAILAATGALGAARDALVGWNAASLRAGGASALSESLSPHPLALLAILFDGILHLGPFLLFAALGLASPRGRGILAAWLAAAIVSVLVQGKLYRYHYQFVLAPLMALAAAGAAAVESRLRGKLARAATPLVAAAAIAALLPFASVARAYWREHRDAFAARAAGARPGDDGAAAAATPSPRVLESYVWSSTGMRYADAARVAEIVRGATRAGDRIYVLGFDPQIYLLADRAPAGRYLAHDHIRYPGAEARLAEDFARHAPRWVIVATDQVGPREFPLAAEWIGAHTEPRGSVGRFALFERTP